jgi:hypothetical protein
MSLPNPRMNAGCPSDLPHALVRDHVAHILQTPGFVKSECLKRFLSFAAERYLAGDINNLRNTRSPSMYSTGAQTTTRRSMP